MEQYIVKQFSKNEPIHRGAEVDAIVEEAVNYALSVLNDVWECETLNFWQTVDSDDLYYWMQEDRPALAESIRTRNLREKFHRRRTERTYLQEEAETMVGQMGQLDLQAILDKSSDEARIAVIKQYIDEKADVDTDKWQYGQGWEDDEDYADDRDDSDEDEDYEDFAVETIAHEALKIIVGREQSKSRQTGPDSKFHFMETSETCAIIDEVRTSLASPTSFYVIDNTSLPVSLRGKSPEKRCIVVRVADQWLENPNTLTVDGIRHRLVRVAGNVAPVSVFALGSNALWLDAQKAIDIFRLMRHEFPILYVGSAKSVLVTHRYNHFADLCNLWLGVLNGKAGTQTVTLDEFEVRFPEGTVVTPALKRNVVDMTQG